MASLYYDTFPWNKYCFYQGFEHDNMSRDQKVLHDLEQDRWQFPVKLKVILNICLYHCWKCVNFSQTHEGIKSILASRSKFFGCFSYWSRSVVLNLAQHVINIAEIIHSPHNDASQVFQTYFHWLKAGTRSFFGCKFGLISRTSPPLWILSAEQSGPHWLNSQTLQRKVHVHNQAAFKTPTQKKNVEKKIFKK